MTPSAMRLPRGVSATVKEDEAWSVEALSERDDAFSSLGILSEESDGDEADEDGSDAAATDMETDRQAGGRAPGGRAPWG